MHLRLIPTEHHFLVLFARQAEHVSSSAELLRRAVSDGRSRRLMWEMRAIEAAGRDTSGHVRSMLRRTLNTPFDVEDLVDLTVAFDGVLGSAREAGLAIRVAPVEEAPPIASRLARLFGLQAELIERGVVLLERRSSSGDLSAVAEAIHYQESEADALFGQALADLYEGVTDVPGVIRATRWGDVYRRLEETTDSADRVGTVMKNLATKLGR